MQARVEPPFLFNTLAQVKRLYEMDATLAQRMLDDLVAYLRAAMPHMRDTSSTMKQEIELARAYLDIVKIRLGDRLAFDIQVPEGAGDVRMPPMMLLPLIDHAVVRGLATKPQASASTSPCANPNILGLTDGHVRGLRTEALPDHFDHTQPLLNRQLEDLRDLDIARVLSLHDCTATGAARRTRMESASISIPYAANGVASALIRFVSARRATSRS
jgi:Histidine kinase